MSTKTPASSPQKTFNHTAAPPPYSTTSVESTPIRSLSPVNTTNKVSVDESSPDVEMENNVLGSPIGLSMELPECSESPAWIVDPTSLISRSMIDGAYPKLLSVLEGWKLSPLLLAVWQRLWNTVLM